MKKCVLLFLQAAFSRPLYVYMDRAVRPDLEMKNELLRIAEAGVSHLILAFYMPGLNYEEDSADVLQSWVSTDEKIKVEAVEAVHAKGSKIMMSTGGEAMGRSWLDMDPIEYGTVFCSRAVKWHLDGVDFDLEGVPGSDLNTINWMIKATKACREVMPNGLITSAPQGPYMDVRWGTGIAGNAWTDVAIYGEHDVMLIQRYNQGLAMDDESYYGLFESTEQASIGYLMKKYPELGKKMFVLGKPLTRKDAYGTGYIPIDKLKQYVCKAEKELGYEAGLMFWQAPGPDTDLADLRLIASECGSNDTSQTTTPKPSYNSSTTNVSNAVSSSGPISSTNTQSEEIPAWKPQIYATRCNKVSHKGKIWANEWWVSAREEPDDKDPYGPWRIVGSPLSTCKF